jgi:Fe-S oxidoreductase
MSGRSSRKNNWSIKAMYPLIDSTIVKCIRETGKTDENLPDRVPILEEYGFPYDQPAENVIISGCQILPGMPGVLNSLVSIFKDKGLSHTFLSKEYCCGNYLYRPAIAERNEQAMAECRGLSREFVGMNIEQAQKLGAKRIIIFCSPCYPIYKNAYPKEDIIFYPQAIKELLAPIKLDEKIDYYAGCYRLHKRFSPVPMDLVSTDQIFQKMEGLKVNRISSPKCCYHPDGLAHMIDSTRTNKMVHICTGCYLQATKNMPPERKVDILMLSEFVKRVLKTVK